MVEQLSECEGDCFLLTPNRSMCQRREVLTFAPELIRLEKA